MDSDGQLTGDLGLGGFQLTLRAVGLAQSARLEGLFGQVLCVLLLQGGLIGLQGVLGRPQLVDGGGDVADGDARVLARRLRVLLVAGEQRGVGAGRPGPVVDVGPNRLLADIAGPLADQALVLADLLVDLGHGLIVGGDLGRGHRDLLLIGVHLQLLLYQALREGRGLGPETGDLVGPHGSGNQDLCQGGRCDESREKHNQQSKAAVRPCVELRLR